MKLSRITALVAASALAPAFLLTSPAFAADAAAPAVATSVDRSSGDEEQAEKDRVEILRIIGAAKPGSVVAEAGSKAMDQGAAAIRAFLETGQHVARDQDNRIRIAQLISVGGPSVQEDGRAALNGSPEDRVAFLETGQHEARDTDNRVKVAQIISVGGHHVREAGKAALRGTPEDRVAFLETGQHEARKKDEKDAEEGANGGSTSGDTGTTTGDSGSGSEPAESAGGSDAATGSADAGSSGSTGTTGSTGSTGTTGSTGSTGNENLAADSDGSLARTGTDSTVELAVGGAAVALAAGAGLLFVVRRRRAGTEA